MNNHNATCHQESPARAPQFWVRFAVGLGLTTLFLAAPRAHAEVTLRINNKSGQPVCVMWTGVTSLSGLTSAGGNIQPSDTGANPPTGYSLSAFTPVAAGNPNLVQIPNFTMGGGRMWFTYGANCWTIQSTGYTPSLANFNDANFTLRYDKIEAFITGSTDDNLDITAVDGFSIPFSVKAYASASPSTTTQTLRGTAGNSVIAALRAIAADAKAPAPAAPAGGTSPMPRISGNSPYLVINANSQGKTAAPPYQFSPYGSSGTFVRIIANDNQVATFAGDLVAAAANYQVPANYNWGNYNNYLKRMDSRSPTPYKGTTNIVGSFVGVLPPKVKIYSSAATSPQAYSLTATFDATEKRTVTYVKPFGGQGPLPPGTGPYTVTFTGFVTLKGTSTIAAGSPYAGTYAVEIKIPYGSLPEYMAVQSGFTNYPAFLLDPSGVVGANANYLYKYYLQSSVDPGSYSQTDPSQGGPQDNVLTWIEGDLLAGMNVGTVGSDKTLSQPIKLNGNTYPAGTPIGSFNSQDWWELGSTLHTTNSVYDYYFGFLQRDTDYYNRYAETIYPFTDAYGFAYSDRITGGRAAISWNAQAANPIDTVEITILPDALASSAVGTVDVVEYYNASLDHYFITWLPDEIAKLDAATVIKGWTRTGRSFKAYPTAEPGASPVCRFYIPPTSGDSHFFGRDTTECNAVAASYPNFVLEASAFMYMFPPNQGSCPPDTSPIYRVFNNRASNNHRYVADTATRDQMVARGWLAEGDGADRVVMCAPQ
jgi:hypothetical protein